MQSGTPLSDVISEKKTCFAPNRNAANSDHYSNKVEFDKFYTKESVAQDCLSILNLDCYDFIIEPSAGNGSFFKHINHDNKVGFDIKPECDSIYEQNFFTYHVDPKYKNVLIVGNPPFGIRNRLSIDFIRHAMTFENVKTIAFVLPDVFNKHTLQKYIHAKFRIKEIKKIPPFSFEINGNPFNMPCSFFIFDISEGPDLRFRTEHYKDTNDFEFGSLNNYDFFILGASPRVVIDSPALNNRGYYIKVKDSIDPEQIKENFRDCPWSGYSSVSGGASWLTRPEIVFQYITHYKSK